MKRPNTDFCPGGRLRSALPLVRPIHPDIDNLAKFVLDSLNGILAYKDDCQVVKLVAYKLMDKNAGLCTGRTIVDQPAMAKPLHCSWV